MILHDAPYHHYLRFMALVLYGQPQRLSKQDNQLEMSRDEMLYLVREFHYVNYKIMVKRVSIGN
jgi:hypothetical protein